jgi:hypothetical protein
MARMPGTGPIGSRSDAEVANRWHSGGVRMIQRRLAALGAGISLATALGMTIAALPASAHQPVELGPSDSTPARGPLLVDGTVSFAVYADVRRGDRRGFRFGLAQGDTLAMQLLIIDAPPGNRLNSSQLPRVTVTDPRGRTFRMVINERTEFYEPYGGTDFLYLSRVKQEAVPGEYRVSVSGRSSTQVRTVIAVGYREVRGEVRD